MKHLIVRFQQCFYLFLIVSLISVTTAQTTFSFELVAPEQVENSLIYVEKQGLSDEEVELLSTESEKIDQVTAGHRPVPVPARRGIYSSDVLFWLGFSLIMLSLAVYPY